MTDGLVKNFWYGVEHSEAVTSQKPKAITLLDREIVLYRGESGELFALDRRCAHRHSALDQGWVEGNCIRCPYHGWRYEPDGSCTEIPANPPGIPIPLRARLRSYPVRERYGLIWLFWGEADPAMCPGIPDLPEFDQPVWRTIRGSFVWDGHYTRALANTIDMAHAPFVHSTAFGNKQSPMVKHYKLERQEWSASGTIYFETKPAYSLKLILGNNPPKGSFRGTFYLPNITRVDLEFAQFHFVLWMAHVPISDCQTVTQWLHIRNFVRTPLADPFMRSDVVKTFIQDNKAVSSQPVGSWPQKLSDEIHVPSDALEVAYRKCVSRAQSQGSSAANLATKH